VIPRGLPVNVANQICFAVVFLCGIAGGQATSTPSAYLYLLRLEHSNFEGHSCVLLQNTGAFHLEVDHGDNVKVFEGNIETSQLLQIERDLNGKVLTHLSQSQIQEPLIRTRHDELQVTIFRSEAWRDLFFQSGDSQQPFKRWLQPLVHWLDNLPRVPHRELSEDEGKNRCLPAGVITLKKRGDSPPESITPKTTLRVLYAGPTPQPQPQPSQAVKPQSVPALLRIYSFEMKTGSAHESCVLVGENGIYRFEDRKQKTGKPVSTRIIGGQISADELQQLRLLLDDPAFATIQQHEPPGHKDVPMMGDKLEISIARPAGVQNFVLSSRFNRPDFPTFYGGDANSSEARPLLKFLTEHVETNAAGILDPTNRNGCTDAP
jgi:hypothetical protein